MRAHEKMLLNSTVMTPVPYTRHDGVGRGCALGMMEGGHIVGSSFAQPEFAETQYPWLRDEAKLPCQCHPLYSFLTKSYAVAHLFNEHVCKNMGGIKINPDAEPWTMERLADYIKSIDPTVDQDEEILCETEAVHEHQEV